PGTVITYIMELRNDKLPQLYLWEPNAYKDKVNSFTLYYGIVIGIAGLLALFLTILFVVKGSIMFPAAAALGWAVLGYISIDFGFWGKVFDVSAGAERVWGATREAVLAATLLVFLFAYLHLNPWPGRSVHTTTAGPAFLGAPVRPRVAWFPRRAGGAGGVRSAGGLRHRPLFAGAGRGRGFCPYCLSGDTRLRPRRAADPHVAPVRGVGVRGRPRDHRACHQ